MRVVGCAWPSMPMRTLLTPAAPTAMRVCRVAITVSGRSTTTRAGESSVAELRRERALGAHLDADIVRASDYVDSIELARCLCGRSPHQHQQRYEHCRCHCHLLLSHFASPQPAGPGPRVLLKNLISVLPFPVAPSCLDCRREDSLHHFPREGLAQLVLQSFPGTPPSRPVIFTT